MVKSVKLNLGCGTDIRPGWVNCDFVAGKGVDKVFDLTTKFPFEDRSVQSIDLNHVLEHIQDWPKVIEECYRVMTPFATLRVAVPYGMDGEPWHIRYFLPSSMDAFLSKANREKYLNPQTAIFKLSDCKVYRQLPFAWRLSKLRKNKEKGKYTFPFGRKIEIVWYMEKR